MQALVQNIIHHLMIRISLMFLVLSFSFHYAFNMNGSDILYYISDMIFIINVMHLLLLIKD